jgi:ATP-dependent helicase HepA
MSEREPELGLGMVASVEPARIAIEFPAAGERRLYAASASVLKRVQFRPGETVATREGGTFVVETVEEEAGLLVYLGGGVRAREDAISDVTSVNTPQERLLAGQTDSGEVFDLRYRSLQARTRFRQSDVRGFLGGRVELIPHQFYILREVASRQIPRALLADEVGLGKTIEACLILQRLLAVGQASRALVLVPESLTHQWFVELLRRFNLWFSIYDEERCLAAEQSDPEKNPFLATQLVLCSIGFLAANQARADQAVEAGWDLVVVDEAHHLEWTPEQASPEYGLVERLAERSPGLLLLTATPTQLGQAGHFARLRLLDPQRYGDFEHFREEAERFGDVAAVAEKIIEKKPLKPKDRTTLAAIFDQDPETLRQRMDALAAGEPGAREDLLRSLLDQHGTGRVMFRNTRAAMTGFPKRQLRPAPIEGGSPTLLARIAREMEAEETGNEASIRYSFKDDPRIDWLADFIRERKGDKALLICRTQRKVMAIEAALQEKLNAKVALFHEGLALVQRDRNAAWFAEPDGAQLLICSEIGSEGRNFQFAHHLVLFDLPLNPGLVEQRIGRLDRIGQTQTIRIHVPYLVGSSEEGILDWFTRGIDAFEKPLHGGSEYQARFKQSLLELASSYAGSKAACQKMEALIEVTAKFRKELDVKLRKGRDRLLELNSFDQEVASQIIERIQQADTDGFLRRFLVELLDHFGVRIREHEEGDLFLDPSHAYVEGFPSIPRDGMLATFSRQRAVTREDIRFITADHPLVEDAIEMLVDSPSGTASFGLREGPTANLLLEAVFLLEAVADSRWRVDQFLAPTPVRVLIDIRSRDLSDEIELEELSEEVEDAPIQRFLERPGFDANLLKALVEGAVERAEIRSRAIKAAARERAATALGSDLQRLVELQRINDHIRAEEIELSRRQMERVGTAIGQARLRLDSLRLIAEGPTPES